jgi:HPr kinase/phosphorylase
VEVNGIGVVLLGPSGAGKSDLALRLIDSGATLVADDQVHIEAAETCLLGRAAEALAGLLEVRGLGILRLPYRAASPLGLVVELDRDETLARLPSRSTYSLLGTDLRYLRLDPREASADAKVRVALTADRVA